MPGDHAQLTKMRAESSCCVPAADKTRPPRPSQKPPVTTAPHHVVRILPAAPTDSAAAPRSWRPDTSPFGARLVADRMLHPGVGHDDEEARHPRAEQTPGTPPTSGRCGRGASRRKGTGRGSPIPGRTRTRLPSPAAGRSRRRRPRENCAQLVPNWNSMGMPVTTPMAKLMAKIFAQKRAARL